MRGIAFMLLAVALLIPCMNAVAKLLLVEYHVVQVAWARFAGHLFWMTLIFFPQFGFGLYATRRIGAQLGRGTAMFVSNSLFLIGLSSVALATATAIMFTSPLLVTLIAVPLLGERVGVYRRVTVVIGLIGALIIVRPDFSQTSVSSLLVLGSAICFAYYQVLTRRLINDDPPETMIVYTAVIATVVLSLIVPWYISWPTSVWHWFLFILLGFLGGLAQYFVAKALSLAPASTVAPLQYTEIVSSTAFGLILFHTLPDALTWVGAAVIVVSGLMLVYRERKLGRR